MKLEDIDKNFRTIKCDSGKFKLFDLPNENFKIHGVVYDIENGFHRIPNDKKEIMSEGVKWTERHTSGGRISFSTNSRKLYLKVEYKFMEPMPHMPLTSSSGFTLTKIVKGKYVFFGNGNESFNDNTLEALFNVSNKKKFNDFILHLPLYNNVKSISLGVDIGAEIKETNVYRTDVAPMLFYGSSITQGGCASRPDNMYQAYVSEKFKVDYINLGFSGSAKAEPEMIDYLCTFNPSIFVLDYDHNAPTPEYLEQTHEKLFKAFRKAHPLTPVIMISKPNYRNYGKIFKSDRMHKDIIYKTYKNALDNGDKNVYFIDGGKMYPADIREHCSVDTCHPTDLGFYFMGKAINKVIEKNKLL